MITAFSIIVKLLVVYLYAILFYTVIPFSLTTIIGIMIVLLLLFVILCKLTKKTGILLYYLAFIIVYTCYVTSDFSTNLYDLVRVLTVMLFLMLFLSKTTMNVVRKALESNTRLLLYSAQFCSCIVLVMLFIPSCYTTGWGDTYFIGLSPTMHVSASNMCLCLTMQLYGLKDKPFSFLETVFIFPPLVAIINSGARTYFLCALGFALIYYITRLSGKKISILVVPVVLSIAVYLFMHSSMADKFDFVNNAYFPDDYNQLDRFTTGRTMIWRDSINALLASNVIQKLFGHGFVYIRELTSHSGHNDIIHTMLGIGITGMLMYLSLFWKGIRYVTSYLVAIRLKFSKVAVIITGLAIYIFSPMLFNGIVFYPHLFFSIFFLLIYIRSMYEEDMQNANLMR